MKKFLIGAMILGFAGLGHSQNSFEDLREFEMKLGNESPVNTNYLNKVEEGTVAPKVLNLQQIVANFNLLESSIFTGNEETYEVAFKHANSRVLTTFDREGKILCSYEWFKDVIFPTPVRNSIYREYPGWLVLSNEYLVSYTHNMGTKKVYKVKIGKGNLQKNLKIDAEGNIL